MHYFVKLITPKKKKELSRNYETSCISTIKIQNAPNLLIRVGTY